MSSEPIEILKSKGLAVTNAYAYAYGAAWTLLTDEQKAKLVQVLSGSEPSHILKTSHDSCNLLDTRVGCAS